MNTEYYWVVALVGCILLFIGFIISVLLMTKQYDKHKQTLEGIMMYNTNTSASIDKSIPTILQDLIDETFADYRVMHLEPLSEIYITPDREIEIRKELADIVGARISKAMLDKLSLFWEAGHIGDVCGEKIYITVMTYVAQHNALYMPNGNEKE